MKNNLNNQLATLFLVAISFVNGFLVANHLQNGGETSEAKAPDEIEDVFVDSDGNTNPSEDLQNPEEVTPVSDPVSDPVAPSDSLQIQEAPFVSQGIGGFVDPWNRYAAQACVYMAMKWVWDQDIFSASEAGNVMLEMDDFLGYIEEPSSNDIFKLFQEYYVYPNVYLLLDPSTDSIRDELSQGHIVLLPVNAQKLNNPYFKQPAATYHVILVLGYDESTGNFTAHDPGISNGANFNYSEINLAASILGDAIVVTR